MSHDDQHRKSMLSLRQIETRPVSGLAASLLCMAAFLFASCSLSAQVINQPVALFSTNSGYPARIAQGTDGALWFATFNEFGVGRIDINGIVSYIPVCSSELGCTLFGIATGSDGALWVTGYDYMAMSFTIWKVTTEGDVTPYPQFPSTYIPLNDIVAGPDGAMWFTSSQPSGAQIGSITTSGDVTLSSPLNTDLLRGLAVGGDGALWTTNWEGSTQSPAEIIRFPLSGGAQYFPAPTLDTVYGGIVAGPDGALWFTENSPENGSQIGRITTDGTITDEFLVSSVDVALTGITLGSDGALWFVEQDTGVVGRITTAGSILEWSIGGDIYPFSISAGPCYGHSVTEEFQGLCDYGLWITQQTTIAHVTLVTTPAQRFPRPVPMGVSISPTPTGPPNTFAGTAGMRVQSKSMPSQKFILSNSHVLSAIGPTDCPNTAHKGITWALQPGTLDIGFDPGNDPHYYVGTVANYVPQTTTTPNRVDAAIASTTDSLSSSTILGIGQPTPEIGTAYLGEPVTKSGRSTGVTAGVVIGINCQGIAHDNSCGTYKYQGEEAVFGISPWSRFSQPGDSGSAVLDSDTLTPVGLLYAGSGTGLTLMNPIASVYDALGVLPDGATPWDAIGINSRNPEVDDELLRVEDIQARHEDELFAIPGLAGNCVSRSASGYEFQVYVTDKTPKSTRAIPSDLEGVPVRVIDTHGGFTSF